jgi:hypothetical protein
MFLLGRVRALIHNDEQSFLSISQVNQDSQEDLLLRINSAALPYVSYPEFSFTSSLALDMFTALSRITSRQIVSEDQWQALFLLESQMDREQKLGALLGTTPLRFVVQSTRITSSEVSADLIGVVPLH